MGKFKIYRLRKPPTRAVFYVGVTNNPERRLLDHLAGDRGQNPENAAIIADLQAQGLAPEMEIVEETDDEKMSVVLEAKWIIYHVEQGDILTNKSPASLFTDRPGRHKRVEGDIVEIPEGYTIVTLKKRHYPMRLIAGDNQLIAVSYARGGSPVSYASKYAAKHFLFFRHAEDSGGAPRDASITLAPGLQGESTQK